MTEIEEQLLEATKSLIIGGIRGIDPRYNNPLTKLAETVIHEHEGYLTNLFQDSLESALKSDEFGLEVKKAIAQKVARTMINESESCVARTVQKLKQNEAFKAKLLIAIDNVVSEMEEDIKE